MDVASRVMRGDYGNGEERKRRLAENKRISLIIIKLYKINYLNELLLNLMLKNILLLLL